MNRPVAVGLAALIGVVLLAGCGASDQSESTPSSRVATSPTDRPTTSTTAPLPAVSPFVPDPAETEAELKTAASRFLETVTTYEPGQGTVESTGLRLEAAGYAAGLADSVAVVLNPAARSVGEIVYPQLGGLTASQASVMTVVRQSVRDTAGRLSVVTRTIDVRLALTAGRWTVTDVASDGGAPPPPTEPSPLAQSVLDNPKLSMPDSSRWDIAAGRISDRLLQLLQTLSEEHSLGITVLASGHPINVFGANSISNHTAGRGVDIWEVDGALVTGSAADGPASRVVASALAIGATEVGAPWVIIGSTGTSFANALHADHLHLAFDG